MKAKHILLLSLIIAMAMLRLGTADIANFAPIAGIGIFAVYYFKKKWMAFLLALGALFLSDLVINATNGYDFYAGRLWDYLGFAVGIVLAFLILAQKRNFTTALTSALGASLLFFIISNFGVWAGSSYYAQTIEGLMACYAAGLPFFKNTLAGDVLFTGAFIGAFQGLRALLPSLEVEDALVR
ncbi:MAG: hypothetical protein KTR13_09340 [Saprospiraceae bacterium]|nr:hypothetical protein [Saprospiraceae bacterium]